MSSDTSTHGLDSSVKQGIGERLQRIYGASNDELTSNVVEAVEKASEKIPTADHSKWDETDIVLITYGDMVQREGVTPLQAQREFLLDEKLNNLISTVHILPFYPYSSDDGFSVIDYLAVNPDNGNWDDVYALGEDFRLAFDLVLNHISSQSEWFAGFLRDESPYKDYFHVVDPELDLTAVIRPRSLPLLSPYETPSGEKHVWTTFSADQIDLNFSEPAVLIDMLNVLLEYAARGAQIIRLDAIAFLWKEIGTTCLHLPQTHEVVKLMRDVLSAVAPHVWLLTETNVPHKENVSYFGNGDEAQMVYQFSLPPLLLDAFTHANATPIMTWLRDLEAPQPGTTYFNFTASHDGVGVRALEGIVPTEQVSSLVDAVKQRGGMVSTRRQSDGTDVPYELNIAYVDALSPNEKDNAEFHANRFLATQAVMLSLQGVPAIYFHSLVGSQNDVEGAQSSGHPRRINRHKFDRNELNAQITASDSLSQKIYQGYRHLLEVRRAQPAFHPDVKQSVIDTESDSIIGFLREPEDTTNSILTLVNVGTESLNVDISAWLEGENLSELIQAAVVENPKNVILGPGKAYWFRQNN